MPGGYGNDGSDKGMATLARQAAFQIFVISNTLAMILSTCAVFSHFLASGLPDKNKALKYYGIATFLIVVAMIAMVVAFTAGTCGLPKTTRRRQPFELPCQTNESHRLMVMEPKLYVAAMEGKTDVLRECMNRQDAQLTANNNTVLHVAGPV
ncbi:hypothetical protein F0562_000432 [Nyssa sinensis]|uniref:PGG domain-containing protein n=1 Tax=Nyssa sinensis TaxID=561372 RepID=A0A5J5C0F7_9ASTE|nr:hypothetical protein F0562_000432 [Nyssa sinensis]